MQEIPLKERMLGGQALRPGSPTPSRTGLDWVYSVSHLFSSSSLSQRTASLWACPQTSSLKTGTGPCPSPVHIASVSHPLRWLTPLPLTPSSPLPGLPSTPPPISPLLDTPPLPSCQHHPSAALAALPQPLEVANPLFGLVPLQLPAQRDPMGCGEIIHVIKSWCALIILITIHTSHLPICTHCHPYTHPHSIPHTSQSTYPPKHMPSCGWAAHFRETLPWPASIFTPLRYPLHSLEVLWGSSPLPAPIYTAHPHHGIYCLCPEACLLWSPLDCEQE